MVGLGMMGINHTRVWSEIDDVNLVGVADVSEDARGRAAKRFRVPTYPSLVELLDATRPEILSIVVPTIEHAEAAAVALDRGIHVLIEKPVADTVAVAEKIASQAEAAAVIAAVGHVERFNPALLELKARIAKQELGRLFQLETRRIGPFPPRIRDVGVVRDLATHDLDQVRFLLDTEMAVLFAQTAQRVHTSQEDLVTMVGRTATDVVVLLEANWVSPRKVRETVLAGEGGMFLADSLSQDLFLFENNWEDGSWRVLESLRGVSEGNMTRFALRREEPLKAELLALLEAVRTGGPSPIPLREGIEALRLAEAALESARSGAPVSPARP